MRQHAEQREAAIKAQYSPEKQELDDRIEQLRRIGPMPGLSVMHARDQLMLARYEMSMLKIWEDQEIERAWQSYDGLW